MSPHSSNANHATTNSHQKAPHSIQVNRPLPIAQSKRRCHRGRKGEHAGLSANDGHREARGAADRLPQVLGGHGAPRATTRPRSFKWNTNMSRKEHRMFRSRLAGAGLVVAASVAILAAAPTAALAGVTSNEGSFRSFGGFWEPYPLCLTASAGTPAPGTTLDSSTCSPGAEQGFGLRRDQYGPGQEITLGNLCVVPSAVSNGASVVVRSCTGTESQNWTFDDGTLYYAANPSYCLDVNGGNTNSGTPVDIAYCNGTYEQFWVPSWFTFTIHSSISSSAPNGLCLDDYANKSVPVGRVDSGACNGTAAQVWDFDGASSPANLYLSNAGGPGSNCSCLGLQTDAPTGNDRTGTAGQVDLTNSGNPTPVMLERSTASAEPNPVSGVTLVDPDAISSAELWDNGCLDVYGGSSTPNTTVDEWWCNGTYAQTWHIQLTG
jgi:hypothetical protein